MQIFIDSADSAQISALRRAEPADGVTASLGLTAKTGRPITDALKEICAAVGGSVSAEAAAEDYDGMVGDGEILNKIADNICMKLTEAGLRACRTLGAEGVKTNMTLCFSLPQALPAAKAEADFVSPFIGRLDDSGADGLKRAAQIRHVCNRCGFKTKILAASIRSSMEHICGAAENGADYAAAPPKPAYAMAERPLTAKGMAQFKADREAARQKLG